jgi:lipoprotein-anchoring transpeptidase ErfK/SrfK
MSPSRCERPMVRRRWPGVAAVVLVAAMVTGCAAEAPSRSSPTGGAATETVAADIGPTSTSTAPPTEKRPLAARSLTDLAVYATPADLAPQTVLPPVDDLGSPLVLLVLDAREELGGTWLELLLPGRPNGHTGWVPMSAVAVNEVAHEVRVDLDRRELVVRSEGAVVLQTSVAVGDPDHPTPTGRFSITDKLASPDPAGLYGPFAFGLSGRSEVLTEFAGGDGQIGIHGTDDPTSIGRAASHGCIRVPNDVVRVLNDLLALGTPVVIA